MVPAGNGTAVAGWLVEGVGRTLRLRIEGQWCRRVAETRSRGGWFAVIDGHGGGR